MAEGGISLLSLTANAAEDPQTLRMVAGAIANLCGNGMKIEFYLLAAPITEFHVEIILLQFGTCISSIG